MKIVTGDAFLSEQKRAKIGRRKYLKHAGGIVAIAVVAATGYGMYKTTRPAATEYSTTTITERETHTVTTTKTEEKLVEPTELVKITPEVNVAAVYLLTWGVYPNTRSSDWNLGTPYTPILGSYRSDDPRVVNWHIKWALEHGITHFIFVWQLETFHGFLNSKYAGEIGFFIWDSFEDPKFPERSEEREELIRHHITDYSRHMRRSNYLKIDGRPVIVFGNMGNVHLQYGSEWAAESVKDLRKIVSEISGKDPYIFGDFHPYSPQLYGANGPLWADAVDGFFGYYIIGPGFGVLSYDDLINTNLSVNKFWFELARKKKKGFIPHVLPSFSNKILHDRGIDDWLIHYPDSSPEKFRIMCRNARDMVDEKTKMVSVTAWNEYQEGAVIEPTLEYGFSHLKVIRDVFAR